MDLRDVSYETMKWIKLVQDYSRIVVFYVHGTECQNVGNFQGFCPMALLSKFAMLINLLM